MKLLFLSFETEACIETWLHRATPTKGRSDYGYIVVADTPKGAEGPDWNPTLIGPIKTRESQPAIDSVADLLRSLGVKVVRIGEQGDWEPSSHPTGLSDETLAYKILSDAIDERHAIRCSDLGRFRVKQHPAAQETPIRCSACGKQIGDHWAYWPVDNPSAVVCSRCFLAELAVQNE